tara:strand:+ start:1031 stop:1723 length:693 start_codon:yes stop_codon:yes gene_type:complete
MAVSVDTVYQRVLAILNKEQRGYLPPAEYQLFANHAQLDIFEQYFYDLNQFSRLPGNSTEYSDMVDILEEKISIFEKFVQPSYSSNHFVEPTDLYRLGTVIYNGSEAEHVNKNEYLYITSSPLSKPTNDFPIYTRDSNGIKIYGAAELTNNTGVIFNYIKKPTSVVWNFKVVLGSAQHRASGTQDFELHESEETELVIKILQLAGVSIKDLSIYQLGNTEEQKSTQQEKA